MMTAKTKCFLCLSNVSQPEHIHGDRRDNIYGTFRELWTTIGFGIPPRATEKLFPTCKTCQKDLENVHGWYREIQLCWTQIERAMTDILARIISSSPTDEPITIEALGEEDDSQLILQFRNSTRLKYSPVVRIIKMDPILSRGKAFRKESHHSSLSDTLPEGEAESTEVYPASDSCHSGTIRSRIDSMVTFGDVSVHGNTVNSMEDISRDCLSDREDNSSQKDTDFQGTSVSCDESDQDQSTREVSTSSKKYYHIVEVIPNCFEYRGFYAEYVEDEYRCDSCNYRTKTIDYIRNHLWQHSEKSDHLCEKCGKTLPTAESVRLHAFTHSEDLSFACDSCDQRFRTPYQLRRHKMFKHKSDEDKRFSCEICHRRFLFRIDLKAHMKVHTGENQFPCPDCGKSYSTRKILLVHRNIHTKARQYSCDVCGKSFAFSGLVLRHKRNVHKMDIPFKSKRERREKPPAKNFICEHCGQRFGASVRLKAHMTKHTGEKQFPCPDCGKKYATYDALVLHRSRHADTRRFPCHICGQTFSYHSSVARHKARVHKDAADNV